MSDIQGQQLALPLGEPNPQAACCPTCGAENLRGFSFCQACGQPVPASNLPMPTVQALVTTKASANITKPVVAKPKSHKSQFSKRGPRKKCKKPKRGPHTEQARASAVATMRESWKTTRKERLVALNEKLRDSNIRFLRVELEMSQPEFSEAIGLSRNAGSRIGLFENGLRPTAELIKRMEELAADNGIEWKYIEGK